MATEKAPSFDPADRSEKGAAGLPSHDGRDDDSTSSPAAVTEVEDDAIQEDTPLQPKNRITRFYLQAVRVLGVEERGMRRVLESERHSTSTRGIVQVGILWFSLNVTVNNLTLGMLGPAVYGLSFTDAAVCAVMGIIVGILPSAFVSTFGPRSGCRSLVFARYNMGWWPSKLVVALNIVVYIGYSLIDSVVAGQILSAVSPHGSLSVAVGIVVVAVVAWVFTTFGYGIVHAYERYAWLPQIAVLFILAGVAGPRFNIDAPSMSTGATLVGNRISFFSICLAAGVTYVGGGADYFVYYPAKTPRWHMFAATQIGLTLSFTLVLILGVGLASGARVQPDWSAAYSVSQGALLVEAYKPLGAFGSFCAVIACLGLISNLVPTTYSAGLDFQLLGRPLARVPRPVWNTFGVVIYAVCALAGRDNLAEIFTNFLALMGYWAVCWAAIFLEEDVLFRGAGLLMRSRLAPGHFGAPRSRAARRRRESALSDGRALSVGGEDDLDERQHAADPRRRPHVYPLTAPLGYPWHRYADPASLPVGLAALAAFVIGYAGAVVCMDQVYFVGPIAKLVGEDGADLGNYVAFSWTVLAFPFFRWGEIWWFGR